MDDAEADVLAFMSFPSEHHTKIYSTNPLERVNKEIKRSNGAPTSSGSSRTRPPSCAWSAPS